MSAINLAYTLDSETKTLKQLKRKYVKLTRRGLAQAKALYILRKSVKTWVYYASRNQCVITGLVGLWFLAFQSQQIVTFVADVEMSEEILFATLRYYFDTLQQDLVQDVIHSINNQLKEVAHESI
jgi:hypothetical protein